MHSASPSFATMSRYEPGNLAIAASLKVNFVPPTLTLIRRVRPARVVASTRARIASSFSLTLCRSFVSVVSTLEHWPVRSLNVRCST